MRDEVLSAVSAQQNGTGRYELYSSVSPISYGTHCSWEVVSFKAVGTWMTLEFTGKIFNWKRALGWTLSELEQIHFSAKSAWRLRSGRDTSFSSIHFDNLLMGSLDDPILLGNQEGKKKSPPSYPTSEQPNKPPEQIRCFLGRVLKKYRSLRIVVFWNVCRHDVHVLRDYWNKTFQFIIIVSIH